MILLVLVHQELLRTQENWIEVIMLKKEYNALCTLIKRAWNSKDGVLVKLKRSPLDTSYLSLCVGSASNRGIIATSCLLWDGNDLLYEGAINSSDLFNILKRKKICYAEITCVRLAQQGKKGVSCCVVGSCVCKTCRYKQDKYNILNLILSE